MFAKQVALNLIEAFTGCLVDGDSRFPNGIYRLYPNTEGGLCFMPRGDEGERVSVQVGYAEGDAPYINESDNEIFVEVADMFTLVDHGRPLLYLEMDFHMEREISFRVKEVFCQE